MVTLKEFSIINNSPQSRRGRRENFIFSYAAETPANDKDQSLRDIFRF